MAKTNTDEYAWYTVIVGFREPVEVTARTRRHALAKAVYQLMTVHADFDPDEAQRCIITEERL